MYILFLVVSQPRLSTTVTFYGNLRKVENHFYSDTGRTDISSPVLLGLFPTGLARPFVVPGTKKACRHAQFQAPPFAQRHHVTVRKRSSISFPVVKKFFIEQREVVQSTDLIIDVGSAHSEKMSPERLLQPIAELSPEAPMPNPFFDVGGEYFRGFVSRFFLFHGWNPSDNSTEVCGPKAVSNPRLGLSEAQYNRFVFTAYRTEGVISN